MGEIVQFTVGIFTVGYILFILIKTISEMISINRYHKNHMNKMKRKIQIPFIGGKDKHGNNYITRY
jgi:hypothetical protein